MLYLNSQQEIEPNIMMEKDQLVIYMEQLILELYQIKVKYLVEK